MPNQSREKSHLYFAVIAKFEIYKIEYCCINCFNTENVNECLFIRREKKGKNMSLFWRDNTKFEFPILTNLCRIHEEINRKIHVRIQISLLNEGDKWYFLFVFFF